MGNALGLVVVLVAACGEVNENRHLDGGVDSQVADARVPTCHGAAFGAPSYVAALNSQGHDVYLRFSSDELTAYFSRLGSAAPTQSFVATRGSITSPFSTPTALIITNNNSAEVTSPTVTADGLTLYFTSSRTGTTGGLDIWKSTRASTTADFANIANVSELNSTAPEDDVYVVPDGSAIYFSSARNNNVYSVWRAVKSGTGFSPPVEILANPPSFISRVVVSPDELSMFYQIGNDIHETYRASTTEPFMQGPHLTALNSASADQPTWISPDGCRLYFQTDRPNGSGGLDFMVAVRSPQ